VAETPLPDSNDAARVFPRPRQELLRSYTCVACGSRHATWASFRAHRAGCSERMRLGPSGGATEPAGSVAPPGPHSGRPPTD
jgi:hypothetical protein